MQTATFIVGIVLPYTALVVFVAGMAYRFHVWRSLPSPPITLFPAPPTAQANTVNTIQEVLFFKSLLKGDRVLWVLAWMFHAVLLLIFVGHFRVFTNVDALLTPILGEEGVHAMSSYAGGAAGILILLALVLLLVRRTAIQRVREVTGTADYVALLLIGVTVVTGNLMRFGAEHFDLALTRDYFFSLATFAWTAAAETLTTDLNAVFLTHLALACVLFMLIPFSKIVHFGGIFFTHQLIRKQ